MPVCYSCKRALPDVILFRVGEPLPDDAWHMINVAPDAASGGSMVPVCNKCDPGPFGRKD